MEYKFTVNIGDEHTGDIAHVDLIVRYAILDYDGDKEAEIQGFVCASSNPTMLDFMILRIYQKKEDIDLGQLEWACLQDYDENKPEYLYEDMKFSETA